MPVKVALMFTVPKLFTHKCTLQLKVIINTSVPNSTVLFNAFSLESRKKITINVEQNVIQGPVFITHHFAKCHSF